MSAIIVGIISLIVGAAVGYYVRAMSEQGENKKALAQKVEQSEQELANYKKEVAEHLERSASLLEQMNKTCQVAMEQMEQSTKLLKEATPANTLEQPFFATETAQQLAETAELRHANRRQKSQQEKVEISQPPLDYPKVSSGLFVDQKQAVTNGES